MAREYFWGMSASTLPEVIHAAVSQKEALAVVFVTGPVSRIPASFLLSPDKTAGMLCFEPLHSFLIQGSEIDKEP